MFNGTVLPSVLLGKGKRGSFRIKRPISKFIFTYLIMINVPFCDLPMLSGIKEVTFQK